MTLIAEAVVQIALFHKVSLARILVDLSLRVKVGAQCLVEVKYFCSQFFSMQIYELLLSS